MIYPWMQTAIQPFIHRVQCEQFPQALLLVGQQGIGKRELANHLANVLLCEQINTEAEACHACTACHLHAQGHHADCYWLEPEEGQKPIKIDQVRELTHWANQSSQQGGRKVILIPHAECLNNASSNALLKLLEEPPTHTHFILATPERAQLLATLVSRCIQCALSVAQHTRTEAWLSEQLSGMEVSISRSTMLWWTDGAPLLALDWAHQGRYQQLQTMQDHLLAITQYKLNPVEAAAQWQQWDLHWILTCLQKLVYASLAGELSIPMVPAPIGMAAEPKALLRFWKQLTQYRQAIGQVSQLNIQLLLEQLLFSWQAMSS